MNAQNQHRERIQRLGDTVRRSRDGTFAGHTLVEVRCPKRHLLGCVRVVSPVGRLWQVVAYVDTRTSDIEQKVQRRRARESTPEPPWGRPPDRAPRFRDGRADIIDFAPDRPDEGAFDLRCDRCGGRRDSLTRNDLRRAADEAAMNNRVVTLVR